jgi:hypothetical protein
MGMTKLEATLEVLLDEIETLRTNLKIVQAQNEQQQAKVQQQNEQMQAEITRLKAAQTVAINSATSQPDKPQSRRKLLKRMAVVALGATAATTALATTPSEANAAAYGTVGLASTVNFGLSAAPNLVTPFSPTVGIFGLVGITSQTGIPPTPNSAGVYGYGDSSIGVSGRSTNSIGVRGDSTISIGVRGQSSGGFGVYGQSLDDTGVAGYSTNDVGGNFQGGRAALLLYPAATAGIPTTNTHFRGEFITSSESGDASNLYFCSQGSGTNLGTWVRLNQPYTAGANVTISPRNADGTFTLSASSGAVFLASPVRIAASINSGGTLALLASNGTGNVSATFQSIQITGTSIPANARGIIGSLTSVGATNSGNLRLWASGATPPTVNSLNIPAKPDGTGFNLTTAFTVGLSADGKVSIGYSNGTAGATCGFSIDVVAYLL